MPIRTATVSRALQKNGARLHLAMASQTHSASGSAAKPSQTVQALLDERAALKAERTTRQAAAGQPKAKAVREVKAVKAPKAPKAPKPAKEPKVKAAKGDKVSRADKLVKKAANAEAAKKADKKSASKT